MTGDRQSAEDAPLHCGRGIRRQARDGDVALVGRVEYAAQDRGPERGPELGNRLQDGGTDAAAVGGQLDDGERGGGGKTEACAHSNDEGPRRDVAVARSGGHCAAREHAQGQEPEPEGDGELRADPFGDSICRNCAYHHARDGRQEAQAGALSIDAHDGLEELRHREEHPEHPEDARRGQNDPPAEGPGTE